MMVVAITMIVMAITIIVMAIISSLLKRVQKILFADRGRQVANLLKKSKRARCYQQNPTKKTRLLRQVLNVAF